MNAALMRVPYLVLASAISKRNFLGATHRTSHIYIVDMPSEAFPPHTLRHPMVMSRGGKGDARGGQTDGILLRSRGCCPLGPPTIREMEKGPRAK